MLTAIRIFIKINLEKVKKFNHLEIRTLKTIKMINKIIPDEAAFYLVQFSSCWPGSFFYHPERNSDWPCWFSSPQA